MRWLHRLEEWLIAILLAIMTIITFAQVIARYVFDYSFTWALELVQFLFAWLIFLGMAYGVRVGSHIGVDALVKSLGPRAARACGALAAACCIAYSAILFIGGWLYVDKMYMIGIEAQDLPIQQWIPRAVLPLGFGILVLRFSLELWNILSGKAKGFRLGDEAADALRGATPVADQGDGSK